MRFHDVQDIRNKEVKKEQRNEAVRRMQDECRERLSAFCSNMKKIAVFGATFTI